MEKVELEFGAFGTVYYDGDGRVLGSMQYGPAPAFPRASKLIELAQLHSHHSLARRAPAPPSARHTPTYPRHSPSLTTPLRKITGSSSASRARAAKD